MQAIRSKRQQQGFWQIAAPIIAKAAGDIFGAGESRKQAHEQMDMQREFAQQGISWKVADAKRAGIHPLYALGASTHSYSPVTVGQADYGQMGQDLTRAFMEPRNNQDRLGEFMKAQEGAQGQRDALKKAEFQRDTLFAEDVAGRRQSNIGQQLENEMRRLQIRRLMQQLGPGMPNALGSVDPFGVIKTEPSEQKSRDPDVPGREATALGGAPGMKEYRFGGKRFGFSLDVPNSELAESLEGQGVLGHILAPLMFGSHYASRGLNSLTESYGGRQLQARVYRFLQNQGVYPRRKGM